jgi:hypothetical protein
MKVRIITMFACMFSILLISSLGYAGTVPVSVNSQGITFPDNTLQKSAAILPLCSSGEVYTNISGAMVCGKITLIDKSIATCASGACSISSCLPGYANCDILKIGCETDITTLTNCGGCGVACTPKNECVVPTWCNIQSPQSVTVTSGAFTQIYGQIFKTGITEAAGPNPTVIAQLGYGAAGTDPTVQPASWVYLPATYNIQVGNNDEYKAPLTAPAPGTYGYAFRFSLDNGASFTYCDLD